MSKPIEQLKEILRTEIELVEILLQVLQEKQLAIVHRDADRISNCVERELELLKPMESLEQARIKAGSEIMTELSGAPPTLGVPIVLNDLLGYIPGRDAEEIRSLASRLRLTVHRVVNVNQANKILFGHSLDFVRESIRLLTEDYSINLVDRLI